MRSHDFKTGFNDMMFLACIEQIWLMPLDTNIAKNLISTS